ncbi:MAG: DNA repair protein RecO, partial [Pseudomonadota bacterium]|nr:DNA repair protein RecO [Pseudomonadota bacterium]
AEGDYTDSAIKTAKRLTRHVLQPFIGDKPLKSRELFLAGR